MAAPTWVSGQVLTASDVNNWFVPFAGYKTSVTTRSTLTMSIDPDLQFALSASSMYEIRAGVIYTAASGGFKYAWTLPSGTSGGYTISLAQGTLMPLGLVWSATQVAATDGTVYAIQVMGALQTGSAGTFGLQWASNSGPTSLTVGIGSYLTARRIG